MFVKSTSNLALHFPILFSTSQDWVLAYRIFYVALTGPHSIVLSLTSAMATTTETETQPPVESEYGVLLDTFGNRFEVPQYTIKEFRDAIPPECFKRSTLRGMSYVARDLALLACTFYVFNIFVQPEYIPYQFLRFILWNVYGFLNGLFGTGIWVLAHECGHQAFSPSKLVNDTVGFVLHSALLVPYFSWKISHGKHHKSTAHMERDMVFVPRDRKEFADKLKINIFQLSEATEDAPLRTLLYVIGRQIVGWPIYLLTNDTGHDVHNTSGEKRRRQKQNGLFTGVSHFNPESPIFSPHEFKLIVLSDLGLILAGLALYTIGNRYGWANLAVWYFLPYLWVNHWLGKFGNDFLYSPPLHALAIDSADM